MAVKLGSARIDENKNARGGKAGDQTGFEVSTQDWYLHKKGWVVIRAKSDIVRDKIADDMIWACENKNIGYDQGQRNTLYNISKPLGFNCKEVKTPCETDCSGLVRVCVNYAGIPVKNFTTSNEKTILEATGEFEILTAKKYTDSSDYLLRGDILVTKTQGHTVVVLNNGSKSVKEIKEILVTGKSVYVRSEPSKESVPLFIAHKGEMYIYNAKAGLQNGFYGIKYENGNGFISSKYSIPMYV